MTGIERLRKLIEDYRTGNECDGIECGEISCGECIAKNVIKPIATQIEREHAEDCYRMVIDHGTVSRVASEMERHVLGHEGMEDSPVARWARELREALGSLHGFQKSRKVANLLTPHSDASDETTSAYDLLPQEDREAIAWVRENGGLDAVKRRWECLSYYADPVPRSYAERRIASRQRQIDESHAALRRRNARIAELERERDELRAQVDAMRPRLMPEGMEWPRFEDGERVEFGDEFDGCQGEVCTADLVIFGEHTFRIQRASDGHGRAFDYGERVKRPAPKVLDADGVEIRTGDEVFVIATGKVHHVAAIDSVGKRFRSIEQMSGDSVWLDPACFTHRAPVLAADGRPLRVGETVWHVKTGREYVVVEPSYGRTAVVRLANYDDAEGEQHAPDQLTHERHDSWERLEEDVANASCPDDYCANRRIDASDTSYEWAMARDIMRRAKALAGDA